ncbi:MAG TPA: GGDEF domain-containing protein [Spirochaetota bacterium]|nr:GGDEF domain-containing protein [Spirochaetota bacterium]
MVGEVSYSIENQNLKEIIEVAKQISSELNIDHIIKNVSFVMTSKFSATISAFILQKDIDDFTPMIYLYKSTKKEIFTPNFPSILPLFEYFDKQEYNQIPFLQFCNDFEDKEIVDEIKKIYPEFIIPLKSDKGILGVFLQGKKGNGNLYSLEDNQFCINVISFAAISIENANLYRQATVDRMTKLYTHHQFQKHLEEEIKKGQRYDNKFSLLMFDIDHFKKFNDTYGHLQGDIIIKEISSIFTKSVRDVDYPSRYGGEEFIAILPETDITHAAKVAERLRRTVEEYEFSGEGGPFKATISLGVAEFDKLKIKYNVDIIEAVDNALYYSKQNGRNRVSMARFGQSPALITFK